MPGTGRQLSPTGERVNPSPYVNVTWSAPARQPGDEYPPALREIVERAANVVLMSHAQRLECERELAALRVSVTCNAIMREARAEQDTP